MAVKPGVFRFFSSLDLGPRFRPRPLLAFPSCRFPPQWETVGISLERLINLLALDQECRWII